MASPLSIRKREDEHLIIMTIALVFGLPIIIMINTLS